MWGGASLPLEEEESFHRHLEGVNSLVDSIMDGLDGMADVMASSKEAQDKLYSAFNKVSIMKT